MEEKRIPPMYQVRWVCPHCENEIKYIKGNNCPGCGERLTEGALWYLPDPPVEVVDPVRKAQVLSNEPGTVVCEMCESVYWVDRETCPSCGAGRDRAKPTEVHPFDCMGNVPRSKGEALDYYRAQKQAEQDAHYAKSVSSVTDAPEVPRGSASRRGLSSSGLSNLPTIGGLGILGTLAAVIGAVILIGLIVWGLVAAFTPHSEVLTVYAEPHQAFSWQQCQTVHWETYADEEMWMSECVGSNRELIGATTLKPYYSGENVEIGRTPEAYALERICPTPGSEYVCATPYMKDGVFVSELQCTPTPAPCYDQKIDVTPEHVVYATATPSMKEWGTCRITTHYTREPCANGTGQDTYWPSVTLDTYLGEWTNPANDRSGSYTVRFSNEEGKERSLMYFYPDTTSWDQFYPGQEFPHAEVNGLGNIVDLDSTD